MFAGGSYEEVARWFRLFLTSHAKRESPRVEVIVEAGGARAGKAFGVRLRLDEGHYPPPDLPAIEFSFPEVSAGKGNFSWCESLGKRVRGWAREMMSAERQSKSA